MKREIISQALDQLDMNYINEALEGNAAVRHITYRRVLAGVLAAAAVLTCTMGIAMAASPELRQAVLTFFHIEDAEQVPNKSDVSGISQAVIGETVSAEYLKLEGDGWQEWDGVLCQFEGEHVLNNQFYTVADGRLTEVETQTEQLSTVWDGTTFDISFVWGRLNGRVVCYGGGGSQDGTHNWTVDSIPGRMDVVSVTLGNASQTDYRTDIMIYHLDTGLLEDIFAGYDQELVERAAEKRLSSDLKHAIIWDDSCYLADLETGTLTQLEQLTGLAVEPGTNVCFGDDHTLVITRWERTEGIANSWTYHLDSDILTQTVRDKELSLYWGSFGLASQGWLYGLDIADDGAVTVVDLRTGEQAPVAGFTCDAEGTFEINASANKLLYEVSEFGEGHQGFLGTSQLGVLDLEKGTFITFDREGYENNQERRVAWLDDNRVALWSGQWGAETEYYLYVYEF